MRETSTVAVTNTCFRNNNFVGEGIIALRSTSSLVPAESGAGVESNYVSQDDGLRCSFVAYDDGGNKCDEALASVDLCDTLEAAAPERRNRGGGNIAKSASASCSSNALLVLLLFASSLLHL